MGEDERMHRMRGLPVPYLRAWRNRRGMSQTRLAQMAGIARATVAHAESEFGGVLSYATIEKLAAALRLTSEQLLYSEPPAPPHAPDPDAPADETEFPTFPLEVVPPPPPQTAEERAFAALWEARYRDALSLPESEARSNLLRFFESRRFGTDLADTPRRLFPDQVVDATPPTSTTPTPKESSRAPRE